jgi:hypothetical protein
MEKGACFLCHVTNLVTWFLERMKFEKEEGKIRLFKRTSTSTSIGLVIVSYKFGSKCKGDKKNEQGKRRDLKFSYLKYSCYEMKLLLKDREAKRLIGQIVHYSGSKLANTMEW